MTDVITSDHICISTFFFQVLDACVNNCGKSFRLEVASREFETEFRRLLSKSHPKVQERLRGMLKAWAEGEFKGDSQLSLIPSLYSALRREGVDFSSTTDQVRLFRPNPKIKSVKIKDNNFCSRKRPWCPKTQTWSRASKRRTTLRRLSSCRYRSRRAVARLQMEVRPDRPRRRPTMHPRLCTRQTRYTVPQPPRPRRSPTARSRLPLTRRRKSRRPGRSTTSRPPRTTSSRSRLAKLVRNIPKSS